MCLLFSLPISQVFMEGVAANDRFSTPIRVFVPVFFNSRRIFTLAEWLRDEFAKEDKEYGGSVRRLLVGRGLAVANMALWSFNLFGFLLPVYLPRAFKRYYSLYKSKDHWNTFFLGEFCSCQTLVLQNNYCARKLFFFFFFSLYDSNMFLNSLEFLNCNESFNVTFLLNIVG